MYIEKHDAYKDYFSYILEEIINNTDLDHLFHYIRDFMLLENFLKANEITYTFWRALGRNEGQDLYRLSNASHTLQLTDEISDNNCWISFDDVETQICFGKSWVDCIDLTTDVISNENKHPNLMAVIALANKLAPCIKSQL
jgi:hypothetical protein